MSTDPEQPWRDRVSGSLDRLADAVDKVERDVSSLRAELTVSGHIDATTAQRLSDHEQRVRALEQGTVKADAVRAFEDRMRVVEGAHARIAGVAVAISVGISLIGLLLPLLRHP